MKIGQLEIVVSASTLALLGKGALSLSRHMPAPKSGSVFYRWIFDTVQDLANNNDRIGEVRLSGFGAAPPAEEKESERKITQ